MKNSNKFILIKETYPISQHDRYCDGYKYIIENFSKEKIHLIEKEIGSLESIIKEGDCFIYRVGKENGEFKTLCIGLKNIEIIGKYKGGSDA